jgi:FixJ family two-component response regulator
MRLVCAGLMNKQVAAEIGLSEVTVKVHRHNPMKEARRAVVRRLGENGRNPANSSQDVIA